eukprot:167863_1
MQLFVILITCFWQFTNGFYGRCEQMPGLRGPDFGIRDDVWWFTQIRTMYVGETDEPHRLFKLIRCRPFKSNPGEIWMNENSRVTLSDTYRDDDEEWANWKRVCDTNMAISGVETWSQLSYESFGRRHYEWQCAGFNGGFALGNCDVTEWSEDWLGACETPTNVIHGIESKYVDYGTVKFRAHCCPIINTSGGLAPIWNMFWIKLIIVAALTALCTFLICFYSRSAKRSVYQFVKDVDSDIDQNNA